MSLLHRYLYTLLLICISTTSSAGDKSLWEVGAGLSTTVLPDYIGSKETQTFVLPIPYLIYRGERIKMDRDSVVGRIYSYDKAVLDINFGGSIPIDSDDNKLRTGMPDVDAIGEIGLSFKYRLFESDDKSSKLTLRLPLRAALSSDGGDLKHRGWTSDPNLKYERYFGSWKLNSNIGLLFSDRRLHQYIYGVDSDFAREERAAYEASSGYGGWRLALGLSRRVGRLWMGSFLRYYNIDGSVFEDSPLVETQNSLYGGIAVAWVLKESKRKVKAD